MWLAQSHVVVAREEIWPPCLISQTQRQCLASRALGLGRASVPSTLPFLLPIQMPAPGYSHLFSREVGVASRGAQSSRDGGSGWPGQQAFRQPPKYVEGRVGSRSCHVPRARTKENTECFLDDTVSNPKSRIPVGGCERVSAVCRSGALLRHPVLSAGVGPGPCHSQGQSVPR